jgi:hypothetical protein
MPSPRASVPFQECFDRSHQRHPARPQLADTVPRDFLEKLFSPREKHNKDAPAVVAAAVAAYQPVLLQPVDQFDDAVVLQRQAIGQGTDGGLGLLGQAPNRQQNEILLRFESGRACLGVAFAQKQADAVAQLGKRAVFLRCNSDHHIFILSHYDISIKTEDL